MTAAVSTALNVLKPGGLCVWIGNSQKIIEVNMQDVVVRAKRITGTYCYNDDFSIIPYLKLSLWNKHLSDHFTFS